MSERPTPETDSVEFAQRGLLCGGANLSLARRLERERDEARKEAAMWKANHDNQVKLKAALMDRPDLGDRARKVVSLAKERDEAREIAKELRDALEQVMQFNGYNWHILKPRIDPIITKAKEVLP